MRFAAAVLGTSAAFALATGSAIGARAPQDKPKTTWDGVYTDDQAKRGGDAYSKTCAACHAPDLSGMDTAPSLTGGEFNASWNDQTVDDLFERARTTMPADAPGSLTRAQYADIVAFILSKDNFPAGQTELPADNAALKQIKFTAQRP